MNSLLFQLKKTIEVLRSPKVDLDMFGDETIHSLYLDFSRPHPRFPFFAKKGPGAALIFLPDEHGEYIKTMAKELTARKCRKASKAGYSFRIFSGAEHYEDLLEINRSSRQRQGRDMDEHYINPESVRSFCDSHETLFGVFNSCGGLVAYADVPVTGDMFLFSTILGHASFMNDGIMYLLVSEVLRHFIEVRRERGFPRCAMYDMFWGAKPGLYQFKKMLGFKPFRVTWHWKEVINPG